MEKAALKIAVFLIGFAVIAGIKWLIGYLF